MLVMQQHLISILQLQKYFSSEIAPSRVAEWSCIYNALQARLDRKGDFTEELEFWYITAALKLQKHSQILQKIDNPDFISLRIFKLRVEHALDCKDYQRALHYLNELPDSPLVLREKISCLIHLSRFLEARELMSSCGGDATTPYFKTNRVQLAIAEQDWQQAKELSAELASSDLDRYVQAMAFESLLNYSDLPTEAMIINGWREMPVQVSVFVIAYKQEQTIYSTLSSLLRQQTDFPFEILVLDDASPDRTQGVIRQLANRYPRIIRLALQERNLFSRGIKSGTVLMPMAKGELIAKCEGDDFWCSPVKLQYQYDAMMKYQDAVICFHPAVIFNEIKHRCDMNIWDVDSEYTGGIRIYSNDEVIRGAMPVVKVHTCLYRRDSMLQVQKFNKNIRVGDRFSSSLFGVYGKVVELVGFYGSVTRRNLMSSWHPANAEYKLLHRFGWKAWLAFTYNKLGRSADSDFFAKKALAELSVNEALLLRNSLQSNDVYSQALDIPINFLKDYQSS